MSPLRALLDRYPLAGGGAAAWLVMAFLAAFVVWSAFAELDEVAVAEGEVVPEGQVKVIQHLEGGIIRQIHVQEGERVKVGDPLVQLDLALGGVSREEMLVRLDGLLLTRARLLAEATGQPLDFPRAEAARQPAVVQAEREAYEARRKERAATVSVLREQERQRKLEVDELKAKQKSVAAGLDLARQKLAMSGDLLAAGLTARMEHVQMLSDVEALEGEMAILRSSIPRIESAIAEVRERMREEEMRFARLAQEALPELEVNIARTKELLTRVTDQQVRTQIQSPIDGIVKNLRHHTVGGVVRPGDPIMEVVPIDDRLIVDARLNPADRGYVEVGQRAVVKLTAYDYTRYGGLEGRVSVVAADATTLDGQPPFFRLLVKTDKAWLGSPDAKLAITPGMQVFVEVHTGTRTVLEYLMRPVLKLRYEAFRER